MDVSLSLYFTLDYKTKQKNVFIFDYDYYYLWNCLGGKQYCLCKFCYSSSNWMLSVCVLGRRGDVVLSTSYDQISCRADTELCAVEYKVRIKLQFRWVFVFVWSVGRFVGWLLWFICRYVSWFAFTRARFLAEWLNENCVRWPCSQSYKLKWKRDLQWLFTI